MPQKTKTPRSHSKHPLLKQVHHNRWFIWAISVTVIVLGGLFAYIKIATINDSTQQLYLSLENHRNYTNQSLGFALTYPANWVIDTSSGEGITFDNPQNTSESINISTGSIASAATLEKNRTAKIQSTYTLRSNKVTLLTITDAEGNLMQVGIVQTAQKAFFVTGSSTEFNSFVNGIRPL